METDASDMAARLGRLLPALSAQQHEQLALYLGLVGQYRGVAGLTAFAGDEQLAEQLVVESLRLLELGEIPAGWRAVDLGSGNGSPVIPLAVALPEVSFTAVEGNQRRAAFLRQVLATLKLGNVTVEARRVEQLERRPEGEYNLLTSRAYAPPARLLPQARALLVREGEVRGFAGDSLCEVSEAAAVEGFAPPEAVRYEAFGRTRHVYRLVRAV